MFIKWVIFVIILQVWKAIFQGFLLEIELSIIESNILKKIELSIEKADKADFPNKDELFFGVYSWEQ